MSAAGLFIGYLASAVYGCHSLDRCHEQDAEAEGDCDEHLGFAINECNACIPLTGCACVGQDCDDIFASEVECHDFVGDDACHCK